MKKLILALVAVMSLTAAQAQEDNNNQGRGERRRMDKTEMVKHRTDETVKKYGLNEQQAAELLKLNTEYADKMGPGMGGPRGGRGQRMGARPSFRDNGEQGNGQRPELTEEQKQKMEAQRKEREESMKEYDTKLQTILTPEQYKAYQEDAAKMRQRMGGRRGGQRERK